MVGQTLKNCQLNSGRGTSFFIFLRQTHKPENNNGRLKTTAANKRFERKQG